jgi:hypothetical protein
MTSICLDWKDNPVSSIVLRDKTIHLQPVELRVEDYFLIRNKKLNENHKEHLKKCIRDSGFN